MRETTAPLFTFNLYRFVGPTGQRKTELVKDLHLADGMKGLVEGRKDVISLCEERVYEWADSKGLSVTAREPFPSKAYPGKVWLEFRFGVVTL